MISSRNLYNVKFNGIELESKLLKSTSDREIATTLNFINLGTDLYFYEKQYQSSADTEFQSQCPKSSKISYAMVAKIARNCCDRDRSRVSITSPMPK